jgi:hypothetical protein
MSLFDPTEPDDPRDRPRDPAGTQPKVDPQTLKLEDYRWVEPTGAQVDDELEDAIEDFEEESAASGPAQTPRFQFLWGALLAIGVIAVAGLVAVIVAGKDDPPVKVAWSDWQPTTGANPLTEIINHVGPGYRGADGLQLAAITGSQLAYQGQLAQPIVAEPNGAVATISGVTVGYTLCGRGANCTFPGKPTTTRALLVHREALELALYTLHYVTDADNVAVILPKRTDKPDDDPATLFFSRGTLAPELARPVRETLSAITPTLKTVATSPDAALVTALAGRSLFVSHFTSNEISQPLFILDPVTG